MSEIEQLRARIAELEAAISPFGGGARVRKVGGSYQATGEVRAVLTTRAGAVRYVFEFDEPKGLLHIFNGTQLEPIQVEDQ
jgi:hypothetical protein